MGRVMNKDRWVVGIAITGCFLIGLIGTWIAAKSKKSSLLNQHVTVTWNKFHVDDEFTVIGVEAGMLKLKSPKRSYAYWVPVSDIEALFTDEKN